MGIEQALIIAAKVALRLYISSMNKAGKDENEIEAEFKRARAKFINKSPNNLK